MKTFIKNIISEIRVRQWVKNFAVYTALIFSNEFFNKDKFLQVTQTFAIFCLLSSSIYLINDILDKEHDKKHPDKKNRPVASGAISIQAALILSLIGIISGLAWSFYLSEYLSILALCYVVLMTAYSLGLKNLAIIDAIIIAFGFVLRALAGSIIINEPISSWLMVCIISLALLISFGRRKAEITRLGFEKASKHRPVLKKYPRQYLEVMISSLVASSFLSYAMFTFTFEKVSRLNQISLMLFPDTLKDPKWIMLTIPIAFYAIARYLYLIYNKQGEGRPEHLAVSDRPFLFTMAAWLIIVLLIIYIPL